MTESRIQTGTTVRINGRLFELREIFPVELKVEITGESMDRLGELYVLPDLNADQDSTEFLEEPAADTRVPPGESPGRPLAVDEANQGDVDPQVPETAGGGGGEGAFPFCLKTTLRKYLEDKGLEVEDAEAIFGIRPAALRGILSGFGPPPSTRTIEALADLIPEIAAVEERLISAREIWEENQGAAA